MKVIVQLKFELAYCDISSEYQPQHYEDPPTLKRRVELAYCDISSEYQPQHYEDPPTLNRRDSERTLRKRKIIGGGKKNGILE